VRAGLTPLEALQSATVNPARFLGMQGELGTIEKGKLADIVLLGADPLQDIANTQKIEAVIVNGRFVRPHSIGLVTRCSGERREEQVTHALDLLLSPRS
jgi:imidazolonepropionase-like amidohydrolase